LVLTGTGHFSAVVEHAQLDPAELYLINHGNMIMTHHVPIDDPHEGTVLAFLAIGFFLEEQEVDATPRRKKFDRKLPAKPPKDVSTDPNSLSKRPCPSTPYYTPSP
jgi:putative NIF3 family GTP cyclohydrolase 1 type 2